MARRGIGSSRRLSTPPAYTRTSGGSTMRTISPRQMTASQTLLQRYDAQLAGFDDVVAVLGVFGRGDDGGAWGCVGAHEGVVGRAWRQRSTSPCVRVALCYIRMRRHPL